MLYILLHSVHYILLTPALCTVHTSGVCALCIILLSLHFLLYILLTSAFCTLHSPDRCTLHSPDPSTLYVAFSWLLHIAFSWPLHPVRCILLTPELLNQSMGLGFAHSHHPPLYTLCYWLYPFSLMEIINKNWLLSIMQIQEVWEPFLGKKTP